VREVKRGSLISKLINSNIHSQDKNIKPYIKFQKVDRNLPDGNDARLGKHRNKGL